MTVNKVIYHNFRNIADATVELSHGVNVFIGDNAEGKTSALEGIYLLAAGKSFRSPHERELVRFGEPYFEVKVGMSDLRRERTLGYKAYSAEAARRHELVKDGAPIALGELVGVLRAVLFCPEHLAIVKAGPAERRNFLDVALCQLRPVYLASLSRHNRVLRQKNALLKQLQSGEGDPELVDIYSEQLAREAALIRASRLAYISRLDKQVKKFFELLGDVSWRRECPELRYKNSLHTCEGLGETEAFEAYLGLMKKNRAVEIAAGTSLYGAHKDDIEIYLDGREARLYGSQGQQRTIALAMKLGEGEISSELSGEYPVFLFDDVLSELDMTRQQFLLSRLGERQVIMTSCTPPPSLPPESCARFIRVKQGAFVAK